MQNFWKKCVDGTWAREEFRSTQNWIGTAGSTLASATYVPPPVDEMQAGLHALEKFIHTDIDIRLWHAPA